MSNNVTIRQKFIKHNENITTLLDVINDIINIENDINNLIVGDENREESLAKFKRQNEYDDCVCTNLNEATTKLDELNDFKDNLSELQESLESYIDATGR